RLERAAVEHEQPRVLEHVRGRGARLVIEDGHLAEELARAEDRERATAGRQGLRDAHAPRLDDEHVLPRLALLKEHGAGGKRAPLGLGDGGPRGDGASAEQRVPLSGRLAACVRRVDRALPPEIAAAAAALEYASLGEDACRLDLAVAGREPALCDGIAASALR